MSLSIAFTDGSSAPAFDEAPTITMPAPGFQAAPTIPMPTPVAPPAQQNQVILGAGLTMAPAIPAPGPRTQQPLGHLEKFEGAQVGMTEIKISGQCAIDTGGDLTVTLDDLVRAVGVYRVTKVLHYVHPKTGETVRQQVLSPVETLVVVPFDDSNPLDDGIVRARP